MITVAFFCRRKISRSGDPIWPGVSTDVATWYSSG
jgi:hypothetical protein